MPPPAFDEHQDKVGFVFFLIRGFLSERGEGIARLGRASSGSLPGGTPSPISSSSRRGAGHMSLPPCSVVEVLSPNLQEYDLGRKAQIYRDASIPEIVHIDPVRSRLIVHTRADDVYATRVQTEEVWESTALPDFWMDVSWVFGEDRERPLACLQRILAGPPD